MRPAPAATPERQSTVVPNTSKVRARTLLRSEGTVVLREVALNHRKIKAGEDRARWLALQKKVKAPRDEAFDLLASRAVRPPLDVGRSDRNRVARALPTVVNVDSAQPRAAPGFGAHVDHWYERLEQCFELGLEVG